MGIVLAFTSSFVFEVFFKILCLVCILAGAHGIWLLPTMLSIVGGDNWPPTQGEVESKRVVQIDSEFDPTSNHDARPRKLAWTCCGTDKASSRIDVQTV